MYGFWMGADSAETFNELISQHFLCEALPFVSSAAPLACARVTEAGLPLTQSWETTVPATWRAITQRLCGCSAAALSWHGIIHNSPNGLFTSLFGGFMSHRGKTFLQIRWKEEGINQKWRKYLLENKPRHVTHADRHTTSREIVIYSSSMRTMKQTPNYLFLDTKLSGIAAK